MIIGGRGQRGQRRHLSDVYMYDALSKRWSSLEPMKTARSSHALAEHDGRVSSTILFRTAFFSSLTEYPFDRSYSVEQL